MTDEAAGRVPEGADEGSTARLEDLTDEVLPALIARLRSSRLGELEVRTSGWRVRLRRDVGSPSRMALPAGGPGAESESSPALDGRVARSPAVGYFLPLSGLAVGNSVQAGDLLGSVDVLGIAQEVTAPAHGIISRVLAEDGQAVEYGQALIDVDPFEVELGSEAVGEVAES